MPQEQKKNKVTSQLMYLYISLAFIVYDKQCIKIVTHPNSQLSFHLSRNDEGPFWIGLVHSQQSGGII